MKRTTVYGLVVLLAFAITAHLFSSVEKLHGIEKAPLVSVAFSNFSENFSAVETIKLKISAREKTRIRYTFAGGGYEASWRMSKGDTVELLIVTELESTSADREVVTTLYDNKSGRLAVLPLGGTGQQDIQDVKPFINNVPTVGTYALTEVGETFSFGTVLELERFVELIEEDVKI